MGKMPSQAEVLAAAKSLIEAGVGVHWLHPQSKRPAGGDNWSSAPVHTYESLSAAYRNGNNLGIRPGEHSITPSGYLHLIDLDIRKPELAAEAWSALKAMWPDADSAPYVISGSGGESRHLYFLTDQPFRSKKLVKSAGFEMVYDPRLEREVKKNDWEIELFGAPKQAVLPPSIHPDTGEPYRWGRELDLFMIAAGLGDAVPSDTVRSWGAVADDLDLGDLGIEDELMAVMKADPVGLSEDEIAQVLADLPADWVEDRDQWWVVGMALHHEYQGRPEGFDRWCLWSEQSEKFNLKDTKAVWKSFGKNSSSTRNPIRMPTLMQAAANNRLAKDHAFIEIEDEPEVAAEPVIDLLADTGADDIISVLNAPSKAAKPKLFEPVDLIEYDPEWYSYVQRNEEGVIKPTLHNVELIVRNDKRLRGVIGFNTFSQLIAQRRQPKKFALDKASPKPIRQLDGRIWRVDSHKDLINGKRWTDTQTVDIRLILEAPERQGGYGLKTSKRDLDDAIDTVANLNAFHPVRDYLESLTWDGKNRAASLFIDYVGAEDVPYHREAALMWLLGAVTRVYEPGHKFDFVPILEGVQGLRKSTFFRTLAKHWFAELEGDFTDSKGMVEKMQGAWIIELPELQGFSKAEVTTIKGFVSRQTDIVRMAYARHAQEFHRQCVMGGSTNEREYLRDSTGGRRFWPIECQVTSIDTDKLAAEVDQIWAEVLTMYREMRANHPYGNLPLYMNSDVSQSYATEIQESRRQIGADDTLAAQIEEWLDKPITENDGLPASGKAIYRNEVCLLEIWELMMGRDRTNYPDREAQLLGRAMRKIAGWSSTAPRRVPGYGKQRVFVRNVPK